MPVSEQEFRASQEARDQLQQEIAGNVQALQLEQTRSEHALKILAQLAQREQRLREEQAALTPPDSDELERLRAELVALEAQHRDKRAALDAEETSLPRLEQALREQGDTVDAAAQQVDRARRAHRGAHAITGSHRAQRNDAGLAGDARARFGAPRLWQDIEIEAGLGRCARSRAARALECASGWTIWRQARAVARRFAARQDDGLYGARAIRRSRRAPFAGSSHWRAYVRCKNARRGRRCSPTGSPGLRRARTVAEGLALRERVAGRRAAGHG